MQPTRRDFLATLSAMAFAGCAARTPRSLDLPRTIALLDRIEAFDFHTHPGLFPAKGQGIAYQGDSAFSKTVGSMHENRLAGAFLSLVSDMKIIALGADGVSTTRQFEPGEAWAEYERQMADLKALLQGTPATIALNAADLSSSKAASRVAAFIGCEGGDCLEGRPDRLTRMYEDGVRSIQLVHYAQNDLGDLQTESPVYNGLSDVGKEVVREMNRLGMLIDMAHASFEATATAVELSDAPIIISHSQLNWGEWRHPRFLDPEHAILVAEAGGVIGMWPSGFGNHTFADFVENTLRMIDLVGVDHVGLGTDMDGNYKPVFSNYTRLPAWVSALLDRGLTEAEVGQLAGGNAKRVLEAARS